MFASHLLKRVLPLTLALLCGLALWAVFGGGLDVMKDMLYVEHDIDLPGPEVSQPGVPPPAGPADSEPPLAAKDVTKKAVLLSKPEPGFTEEARSNNVTGTVRLRLVLGADGTVSNISVLKGLPAGLTERAIEAAQGIEFIPAQKDGRNVSQWVIIEYSFNIY